MNLNNLGAGKKLIEHLTNGNLRRLGWSKQQQREMLDKQPNPHNINTRKK